MPRYELSYLILLNLIFYFQILILIGKYNIEEIFVTNEIFRLFDLYVCY